MLTDEFKRELRYIVLKVSDMLEHLDRWQYQDVLNLAKRLSDGRNRNGKPPLECVVVESDWPEYETVWKMIEARVAGRAIEAEVLQSCHSQNAIPAPQQGLQSAGAAQAPFPKCGSYAGMSWGGNNVYGDAGSINGVKEAVHYAGQVPEFKKIIQSMQVKLSAVEEELEEWRMTNKIDELYRELDAEKAKVAELESCNENGIKASLLAAQLHEAKVAEQAAEIDRLKRGDFGPERIANHALKTANSVLAERIAELEQANEHHRELARVSRDAELNAVRIAATQGALIEQCEKDAARYQWLRDDHAYAPEEACVRGGDELDALIDAAIAKDAPWHPMKQ